MPSQWGAQRANWRRFPRTPADSPIFATIPPKREERTMAHTPGPWTIAPYHSLGAEQDIIAPNGQRVCSVAGSKSFDEDTNEWIEPDAHLIAAAPDLLAALKVCADRLEANRDEWGSVRHKTEVAQARAAIEKAEGK